MTQNYDKLNFETIEFGHLGFGTSLFIVQALKMIKPVKERMYTTTDRHNITRFQCHTTVRPIVRIYGLPCVSSFQMPRDEESNLNRLGKDPWSDVVQKLSILFKLIES